MVQLQHGHAPKARIRAYVLLDQRIAEAKERFRLRDELTGTAEDDMLTHLRHVAALLGQSKLDAAGWLLLIFMQNCLLTNATICIKCA
jgi:hypothetical protein